MARAIVKSSSATCAAAISGPGSLWSSFIDDQLPSLDCLPVQILNRLFNVNACSQFDKGKAAWYTGIHITDQLNALHLILGSLKNSSRLLSHASRQISHKV
jgi:hypothetical protein